MTTKRKWWVKKIGKGWWIGYEHFALGDFFSTWEKAYAEAARRTRIVEPEMTAYETEVSIHEGVRGRRTANPSPYQTDFEWFADATADTGTSHIKIGRPYVVMCQWTGALFIAPTYKEAMEMFRVHEQQMFSYAEEIRSKRDTANGRNQK